MSWMRAYLMTGLVLVICLGWLQSSVALAQEAEGGVEMAAAVEAASAAEEVPMSLDEIAYGLDNMILLVAAVLVLLMQAGFAMLEVGLNSAKNTVNILFKNVMDLAIGCLLFFAVGYGLMYPGDGGTTIIENVLAFGQVGIAPEDPDPVGGALHPQADFLFQVAFAATAATIVSGAVAGRMKFIGYLIYSAVITAFVYPISGMWKWGGGWLDQLGFHDFAGSILVHAVGGFAGLAGALVLGPRIGRFVKGKSFPIPGHNLTFAALGTFVLWVGWYGFNPGSQLAFAGQANTNATVLIAVNTTLAAAAGACFATILAWILFKKPDLTMALNGALAGLVGITANCDCVTNLESMIIGATAGLLVVCGIVLLDKLRIDDPVGAFPVHGLCGIWGGLATGIFGEGHTLYPQLIGSLAIPAWSFVCMGGLFLALKAVGLLRVSAEDEMAGLDASEHGMHAYPPHLITEFYPGTPISPVSSGHGGHMAPLGSPSTEAV